MLFRSDELAVECLSTVAALARSIQARDDRPLRDEIAALLARSEARGEDAHVWQAAISALYRSSAVLLHLAPGVDPGLDQTWLMGLLDEARLAISEHVQRETTSALLEHMDMMSRLGL